MVATTTKRVATAIGLRMFFYCTDFLRNLISYCFSKLKIHQLNFIHNYHSQPYIRTISGGFLIEKHLNQGTLSCWIPITPRGNFHLCSTQFIIFLAGPGSFLRGKANDGYIINPHIPVCFTVTCLLFPGTPGLYEDIFWNPANRNYAHWELPWSNQKLGFTSGGK